MIIIIGNKKGGAGKSTLTLLLANYLTQLKKRKVIVIDLDYQQSISQKYEKAKVLENEEPYEVVAAPLEEYPGLLPMMKADPEALVLINLPGKLDDDGLLPVFKTKKRFWTLSKPQARFFDLFLKIFSGLKSFFPRDHFMQPTILHITLFCYLPDKNPTSFAC